MNFLAIFVHHATNMSRYSAVGSLVVALARKELDVLSAYDESVKATEAKAEAVAKKEE